MYSSGCKKFVLGTSRSIATRGEKVRTRQAAESKGRQMGDKIGIYITKDDFLSSTNFKLLTQVKGN
jgi:hypothetical protein